MFPSFQILTGRYKLISKMVQSYPFSHIFHSISQNRFQLQYKPEDDGCISSVAQHHLISASRYRSRIIDIGCSFDLDLHVSRQWSELYLPLSTTLPTECLARYRRLQCDRFSTPPSSTPLPPPDNCTIRFRRNRTEIRGYGSVHSLLHGGALR